MFSVDSTLNAAHKLVGRVLSSGWEVKSKIEPKEGATGGYFSVCYIAEKDGQVGFLKAIDFVAFLKMRRDVDFMNSMNDMTASYVYERDLLSLCRQKGLNKIPILFDDGIENVDEFPYRIPYLIFERAEGNVRSHLFDFSDRLDAAWKLKSLHNVAVGLRQLHTAEITHQDIKPSNVFVFDNQISKLGDLGRSIGKTLTISAPHTDDLFTGQGRYVPPEIMYGYIIPDWYRRVYAIDMYLFGSLIVFYFTGLHFNTLLYKNVEPQFHPANWAKSNQTFQDIQTYLLEAFRLSVEEFSSNINLCYVKEDIISLVNKLCNPIPENRGFSQTVSFKGNPYDLQFTISKLDNLRRKAELAIFSGRK